jgi:hypothetical protein
MLKEIEVMSKHLNLLSHNTLYFTLTIHKSRLFFWFTKNNKIKFKRKKYEYHIEDIKSNVRSFEYIWAQQKQKGLYLYIFLHSFNFDKLNKSSSNAAGCPLTTCMCAFPKYCKGIKCVCNKNVVHYYSLNFCMLLWYMYVNQIVIL